MADKAKRIRWWPLAAFCLLAFLALGLVWFGSTDNNEIFRQQKVTRTAVVLLLFLFVTVVWLLFFSRMPLRMRMTLILLGVIGVGAFLTVFRYRGVSGDLVPQFSFRFEKDLDGSRDIGADSLSGIADFTQFLGNNRDSRIEGVALSSDWSQTPPRLVWRRNVGKGWSGFAVSGNAAVTQEQHGQEEQVVRYSVSTGQIEWVTNAAISYNNVIAGDGPRSTPTIKNDLVYVMGSTGVLTVLNLDSGDVLWKREVLQDNGGKILVWGKSDSPLLIDNLVVVSGGSTLVAYDSQHGELIWRAGEDSPAYGAPLVATFDGVRQIISFNESSVTGHDPNVGRVLWRVPWPARQPNVVQPLPLPHNRLLVSSGYGVGAKVFEITKEESGEMTAALVWENIRLKAKFSNLVFYEGFVYGMDDGILVCLDPQNGERQWKQGRYGHGQLLLVVPEDSANALLLIQTEYGELVLVDPSPDGLRELITFGVIDGKVWNSPALAGRYLLVRNDAEAAMFELPTTG